MDNKLIVALDVDDLKSAEYFVEELDGIVDIFKVGSQLFTAAGPEAVKMVIDKGKKVFLDLKFHDIPAVVARASRVAVKLGVSMFSVHTLGGSGMMRAVSEAVAEESERAKVDKPVILGVTVLTSISEEMLSNELGVNVSLPEEVGRLAKLAREAGFGGAVCSAREVKVIRKVCGSGFITVAPGIRGTWGLRDDHQRTTVYTEAIKIGIDFVVVGRPIIQAANPREEAEKMIAPYTFKKRRLFGLGR